MNPPILVSCELCRLLHVPASPLTLHAICSTCAAWKKAPRRAGRTRRPGVR